MSQDLLPSSSTPFERALSLADDDSYTTRALDPELVRRVKDPALCPTELLPYLAWERSLHEWDPAWPEWRKRNAIASSLDLHRRYGTRWGVEQALGQLGIGAELDEWFEYGGRPYCFRVRIPVPDGWTTQMTQTVYRVAIGAKNARSYLDGLLVTPSPAPASVGVGTIAIRRARIYATTGTYPNYPLPLGQCLGTIAVRRSRIYATVASTLPAVTLPPAAAALGIAALRRARIYAKI